MIGEIAASCSKNIVWATLAGTQSGQEYGQGNLRASSSPSADVGARELARPCRDFSRPNRRSRACGLACARPSIVVYSVFCAYEHLFKAPQTQSRGNCRIL